MSGTTTGATTGDGATGQNNAGAGGQESTFQPITSQADLDRLIGDRLARERSKFEGFEDYKAKAAQLEQLQQAGKTEAQKEADRAAKLEKENAQLKVDKLRSEVAAAKKVPASLLTGSTEAEMSASADALLQFRGGDTNDTGKDRRRVIVAREGQENKTGEPHELESLRAALFGSE